MDKYALITGCSKGIGKEIALALASIGYNIIGTYNTSLEEIKNLKYEVEIKGVSFNYYKLDLLDDNNIDKFLEEINNNYKTIDILINNAALSLDNEIDNKTSKEFQDVLKVNLVGPFSLIKGLKDKLKIAINIASTDGIDTYSSLNIDYSASKAGLINLTKSLSLAIPSVKILAICPNWIETESIKGMNQEYLKEEMKRIKQKKLIQPDEISKKIINIINDDIKSGEIIVMRDSNE